MTFLFALALIEAATLLALLHFLVEYARYGHRVPILSSVKVEAPHTEVITVVVPARNEEARVHVGLRSLASSRLVPGLKVIAVNDRSKDRTEALMCEEAERSHGIIEVVDVAELPTGWLGKNHATWVGTQKAPANTKYFLFTDADIVFHEQTIAEAITVMKERQLQFFTVFPKADYQGLWEAAFLSFFALCLNFFTRPWSLENRGGRNFLGIGAFMLVDAAAYKTSGGHQRLRFEVADDMKLGLLFRALGFKCSAANGVDRLQVRWHPGFWATLRGILKNSFAAMEFSRFKATVACSLLVILFLLPWFSIGIGWFSLWHSIAPKVLAPLGFANIICLAAYYFLASRQSRYPALTGLLLSPFIVICAIGATIASAALARIHGGIQWRDTFYVLSDLKKHCFTFKKAFQLPKAQNK